MLFLFDFNNLYAILENVIGANLVVIRKNVVFFQDKFILYYMKPGVSPHVFCFFLKIQEICA